MTVVSPASATRESAAPAASAKHSRHRQPRPARRLRVVRPAIALLAGVLLSFSFPPHDQWELAPVAIAALALSVQRPGRPHPLRTGYALGFLFGLGFLVPLLAWTRVAGSDGWLILAVLQALFVALVGPLCVVAARLPFRPFWIGTAWLVQEAVRDRVPFGGFPWGRLAFVQPADGGIAPVTRLAALGGAPLVTFAVALSGGLLAVAASAAWGAVRAAPPARGTAVGRLLHGGRGSRAGIAVAGLLGVLAVLGAGVLVPVPNGGQPDPAGASPPTATVAAVQGNVPREGLSWMGQRRAVTRDHLAGTQHLAADVAAGRQPAPDLVVWPENSSDLDPFEDQQAAAMLSEASQAIGRPLLVGAVLDAGPGHVRNTGLVWGPQGYLGQSYTKRHPVPFGEYLPGRALLTRLVGRFANDLPNDFVPGHSPGLLSLQGPSGTYRIGDVICFEVAYDSLVRDVVDRHARLLVVQTNNASFGRTGETYQQMAMSRLRSIEHGRSTVVVATSGRSALITPNGTVLAASQLYTADNLVAALPLRSSRTIADRVGDDPEYVLVGLGLLGPLVLLARRRRRRDARNLTGVGARPASPEQAGSTA